jgi:HlyD family secretion protein
VKRKKPLILIIVLLAAAASYAVYHRYSSNSTNGQLAWTGTVEVVEVLPSFQVAGKIDEAAFEEGQVIEAGRILAVIDSTELSEQLARAQANLEFARSRLDPLRAHAQYMEKSVQARIRSAQAHLEKVTSGLRPQEIESARQAVNQAKAAAQLAMERAARAERLYSQEVIPLSRKDEALHESEAAEAMLRQAEEALDLAEEGARPEDIAVAKAALSSAIAEREAVKTAWLEVTSAKHQLELAEAETRLATARLSYATVHSPIDGIVLSKSIEAGETVLPGSPIASIANLSRVLVRFYVEEKQLGNVRLGETLSIRSDSYPGKSFPGTLTFLSDSAEFTPKTIQTTEERTKLVFLAKATAQNPDQVLKPGMPVDVLMEGER